MLVQSINPSNQYSLFANLKKYQNTDNSYNSWQKNSPSDSVTISQEAYENAANSNENCENYDFTNMSPKQMMKVSQNLFDSGIINRQEHLVLLSTGLVFGSVNENGQYTPPTKEQIAAKLNTPINYLQYAEERINFLESSGLTSDEQYGYKNWKNILNTLQKITDSEYK